MKFLISYLKGTVVGVGGIAPGLSGSVMLLILGLYDKVINAIGTFFKNFKKNFIFLLPLVLGFGTGIVLFSKVVDFFLESYEFGTRYLFLGLVIGTVPMFYKEVKKEGFGKKHVVAVVLSALAGIALLIFNGNLFPKVTDPNFIQSMLLGVSVAGSSIVPGVDSAVILSSLGLYELYVSSIASFDFKVLLPAAIGLVIGVLLISAIMNIFIKRFYTMTFSIIFGLFLSIIPSVLTENCAIVSVGGAFLALGLVVIGFVISLYFGDIKGNNQRIKNLFSKKRADN